MPFNQFEPFLAFGGKIDPLTEIRNAGIVTSGRVLWVKAVNDADYTTVKDAVGASFMFNDLQSAVNATRNDKNDYILVAPRDNNIPFGTDVANGSINVNKSRIHVFGLGANKNLQSYAVSFQGFGTTAAAGTPLPASMFNITGPGVEMAGFRVFGTVGTAGAGTVTGLINIGTGSTGTAHDFWLHDVSLEQNHAHGTTAYIYSPGTVHGVRLDNVFIGNALVNTESAGNGGMLRLPNGGKRWIVKDTTFLLNSGSVATDGYVAAGTGATEFAIFKECSFFHIGTGAITSAVRGSTTIQNPIIMENCYYVQVTQAGTDPTVYKTPVESGTSAAVRDLGIAVGTAALQPV